MRQLDFRWARLPELTALDWHAVIAARERVFVVEQNCPYQDADELDLASWHLIGTADGALAAYLRVVDPGRKSVHEGQYYAEPSIGRVVNDARVRGTGIGRALVGEGVARCLAAFPGEGIRISAQAHLQGFYGGFGFITLGEPYLEDEIPHVEMLRPAAQPPGRGP